MIALIQPFGLWGRGGGSRILRGLLECEHPAAISIATVPAEDAMPTPIAEFNLPVRPRFGRLERTRYAGRLTHLEPWFRARFENRLTQLIQRESVRVIHLVPHGYELVPVTNVALKLGIPLFLSIHDDIEYVSRGHAGLDEMKTAMTRAWQKAAGIFAISDEIAAEYSRRHGTRECVTVTDGLKSYAAAPLARPANSLRIYFMGLFHQSYWPNFRALLDALKILRTELPGWQIELTSRSGQFTCPLQSDDVRVTALPFASEREIEKDMDTADLLYMPLPFASYAQAFGRFSLSTKMVTYLGSGLPILYHGPENTAAFSLLNRSKAAFNIATEEPAAIARQILDSLERRDEIVTAALKLARERFDLAEQQRRFWTPMINLVN